MRFCPAGIRRRPAPWWGNPCDNRYIESLATALGFNPYGDTSYTDSDGTAYFSEAGCALQISAAGEILLTSTAQDRFRAGGDGVAELVEEARRLAAPGRGRRSRRGAAVPLRPDGDGGGDGLHL